MSNRSDQSRTGQSPASEPFNPGDQAPPGTFDTGENVCRDCRGSGIREGKSCETCDGTGRVIEAIGGL